MFVRPRLNLTSGLDWLLDLYEPRSPSLPIHNLAGCLLMAIYTLKSQQSSVAKRLASPGHLKLTLAEDCSLADTSRQRFRIAMGPSAHCCERGRTVGGLVRCIAQIRQLMGWERRVEESVRVRSVSSKVSRDKFRQFAFELLGFGVDFFGLTGPTCLGRLMSLSVNVDQPEFG